VSKLAAFMTWRSLGVKISWGRGHPLPIYWYHSKGSWLRYNCAADSFYIMKLCSRLFVPYCRNCPKDDRCRYFPFSGSWVRRRTLVDGSLKSPCRVLVKCNRTSFSVSYGWGATRQMCKNARPSGGGRSLRGKISGGKSSPCQYIDTTRKAIDCATTLPLTVFGRPFVKRFALCYRSGVCPVLSSVCLWRSCTVMLPRPRNFLPTSSRQSSI